MNKDLLQNGFDCSVSYITRIFKQWGWSFKVPTRVNIHKFTIENIEYYFNYYIWAQKQLLSHLKFIDESHFNADKLMSRRVVGRRGVRILAPTKRNHRIRYSVTLLTSLSDTPLYLEIREETNTQFDFAEFILNCVKHNQLKQGDILVCDNASVHTGKAIQDLLDDVIETVGFRIVFLSTYSPELNPCELVFNVAKNYLREHVQLEEEPFENAISQAFATVSPGHLLKMYMHCLKFEGNN